MKQKIIITGQEVHNVGYRYFLLANAMNLGISGFNALNSMSGDVQAVVALIEGSVKAVEEFKKMVESKKPECALVSSIAFEETDVDIMRIEGYAQFCSTVQLNKAIPLLLDMRDDLKEMKGDIKEMKGDIKEMKGDIKEMKGDIKEMKGDIKEMKGDIKAVRKNTDTIPQIHEEIRGMREDIQPGYAAQFRLVQADIRAIKERLGMS